jgi:putative toxin-antitoxin system antitoxin component (TIGR02293 family)
VEAGKVAAVLGGRKVIGMKVTSPLELVRAVRAGFPYRVVEHVMENRVLSRPELEHAVIPRRTMAHRKRLGERLSPEESDRLVRVARVVALAEDTFRSKDKAARWLRLANPSLGGDAPMDVLDTGEGAALVHTVLIRLAHGVYS